MAHWNIKMNPVDGTVLGVTRTYDAPHKLIGTPPRRRKCLGRTVGPIRHVGGNRV